MTDHHDFHYEDDFSGGEFHHDDQPQFEDQPPEHFEHFEDFGHEGHDLHVDPHVDEHHAVNAPEDDHVVLDDHHDVVTHQDDDSAPDLFPPPVDVGDLPEPVDGFPWTDAATLGTPDLGSHDTLQPVDPHELAEYAGTEIPPGADPWTVLADSDDPATNTLARFFHDTGE